MISAEVLKQFCAPAGSATNPQIESPWLEDGKTVAANGHIMIVADGIIGDVGESTDPLTISYKTIEKKAHQETPQWLRMEDMIREVPAPVPCSHCGGGGTVRASYCDDCDGEGEFRYGRHDYKCEECGGDGLVYEQNGSIDLDCPICDGRKYKYTAHIIGGTLLQVRYLRMIAGLPDCELAVNDDPRLAAMFRFSGGRGWLMPCGPYEAITS